MPQQKFIVIPNLHAQPIQQARPRIESTRGIKKAQAAKAAKRLPRAEQRRIDKAEQDEIKRELAKEKALRKNREARERKKAKEEGVRREKRKKGLPITSVRPSQGTLPGLYDLFARAARGTKELPTDEANANADIVDNDTCLTSLAKVSPKRPSQEAAVADGEVCLSPSELPKPRDSLSPNLTPFPIQSSSPIATRPEKRRRTARMHSDDEDDKEGCYGKDDHGNKHDGNDGDGEDEDENVEKVIVEDHLAHPLEVTMAHASSSPKVGQAAATKFAPPTDPESWQSEDAKQLSVLVSDAHNPPDILQPETQQETCNAVLESRLQSPASPVHVQPQSSQQAKERLQEHKDNIAILSQTVSKADNPKPCSDNRTPSISMPPPPPPVHLRLHKPYSTNGNNAIGQKRPYLPTGPVAVTPASSGAVSNSRLRDPPLPFKPRGPRQSHERPILNAKMRKSPPKKNPYTNTKHLSSSIPNRERSQSNIPIVPPLSSPKFGHPSKRPLHVPNPAQFMSHRAATFKQPSPKFRRLEEVEDSFTPPPSTQALVQDVDMWLPSASQEALELANDDTGNTSPHLPIHTTPVPTKMTSKMTTTHTTERLSGASTSNNAAQSTAILFDALPFGTQDFIMSSQDIHEVEEALGEHRIIVVSPSRSRSLLSTQDLTISSQDLVEIGDAPSRPGIIAGHEQNRRSESWINMANETSSFPRPGSSRNTLSSLSTSQRFNHTHSDLGFSHAKPAAQQTAIQRPSHTADTIRPRAMAKPPQPHLVPNPSDPGRSGRAIDPQLAKGSYKMAAVDYPNARCLILTSQANKKMLQTTSGGHDNATNILGATKKQQSQPQSQRRDKPSRYSTHSPSSHHGQRGPRWQQPLFSTNVVKQSPPLPQTPQHSNPPNRQVSRRHATKSSNGLPTITSGNEPVSGRPVSRANPGANSNSHSFPPSYSSSSSSSSSLSSAGPRSQFFTSSMSKVHTALAVQESVRENKVEQRRLISRIKRDEAVAVDVPDDYVPSSQPDDDGGNVGANTAATMLVAASQETDYGGSDDDDFLVMFSPALASRGSSS